MGSSPLGLYRMLSLDSDTFRIRTDSEGRFRFENVPPLDLNLYLHHGVGIPMTDRTSVTVPAGETVEVVVGESQPGHRRIIGRLKASDPSAIRDWPRQVEMGSIYRQLPRPPVPSGLSEEATALWLLDWSRSEAGREHARLAVSFPLELQMDGSFSITSVPPGDYRMMARLLSAEFIGQSSRAFRYGAWIGEANTRVTIPAVESGEDSEFNLGEIEVRIRPSETK